MRGSCFAGNEFGSHRFHRNAQKKTGEDLWHFVRTCTEELQNVQDLPSLLVCTSNYGSRRVRRNRRSTGVTKAGNIKISFLRWQRHPMMSILCYKCFGIFGPPTTGSVIWKINRFAMLPCIHDRSDDPPRRFDLVSPHK